MRGVKERERERERERGRERERDRGERAIGRKKERDRERLLDWMCMNKPTMIQSYLQGGWGGAGGGAVWHLGRGEE